MPTCQHCHNEWSYKQTFKRLFTLDSAMTCPYCDTRQFLTKMAKRKTSILNFPAALVILLPTVVDVSIMISVFSLVLTLTVMAAIYPTLVELSNKEEFMF
ncbi:cxxc_20_cxxc protein [Gracilibacillus orientalis]|uniref:Cxxc_20_cxxc protein n=1 Tax=Gracilibacillus orientalis TaxID=334253 RepID=A0A1I4MV33_9BACI|nr:TIGR04104 family putative zinc finger protein [Gracilibacillus orientalis]SFM06925.1 cxxc_20_cxxc protein [Gracilibacillus orientalis]